MINLKILKEMINSLAQSNSWTQLKKARKQQAKLILMFGQSSLDMSLKHIYLQINKNLIEQKPLIHKIRHTQVRKKIKTIQFQLLKLFKNYNRFLNLKSLQLTQIFRTL